VFLTVLALLMGGLAPAQAATTGTVSGKVTDVSAVDGPGLGGVTVTLIPEAPTTGSSRTATTAADGTYDLTEVPNGTYAVKFNKTGYDTEYYDNRASQADDTPILLDGTNSNWSNLNADLVNTTRSQVGGQVTNASQPPTALQGVTVTVQRRVATGGSANPVYEDVATTTTAANGKWAAFVDFGSYVVRFTAPAFATAYWKGGDPDGVADPAAADLKTVGKSSASNGVGLMMSANSVAFSGRVITGTPGDPVSGVQVKVEYPVTQASGVVTQEIAASAATAPNGTYSLTAPTAAGRAYTVSYTSPGFPTRFYTDATAGQTTTTGAASRESEPVPGD